MVLRAPFNVARRVELVLTVCVGTKSLDLQQAAHAHLRASILKLKAVAESPNLPEQIKANIPKPEVSEEDRIALHNVTSALYNRSQVRDVVDRGVAGICRALRVPVPRRRGRGNKGGDSDGAGHEEQAVESAPETRKSIPALAEEGDEDLPDDSLDEHMDEGMAGLFKDEEEEEGAMSRFEAMLGASSSEDNDEGEDLLAEKDPREISSDGSDAGDESHESEDEEVDEEGDEEGDQDEPEDDEAKDGETSGSAPTPPAKKTTAKPIKQGRATDSTFLPSLMGGYISGSESASDIDVAPPMRKNRRGQRERQAIWEKKYGDRAKHLSKEATGGRDSGWDAKRGAVDGNDKSWKRGSWKPQGRSGNFEGTSRSHTKPEGGKRKRKDDEGPLHPSWEAKKKAKEKQQGATFQGKKITF